MKTKLFRFSLVVFVIFSCVFSLCACNMLLGGGDGLSPENQITETAQTERNENGVLIVKNSANLVFSDVFKDTFFENLPLNMKIEKLTYVTDNEDLMNRYIFSSSMELETAQTAYDNLQTYMPANGWQNTGSNLRGSANSAYIKSTEYSDDEYNLSVSTDFANGNFNVTVQSMLNTVVTDPESLLKISDALPAVMANKLQAFSENYGFCETYTYELLNGETEWKHSFVLRRGIIEYSTVVSDLETALVGWTKAEEGGVTYFQSPDDKYLFVSVREGTESRTFVLDVYYK